MVDSVESLSLEDSFLILFNIVMAYDTSLDILHFDLNKLDLHAYPFFKTKTYYI